MSKALERARSAIGLWSDSDPPPLRQQWMILRDLVKARRGIRTRGWQEMLSRSLRAFRPSPLLVTPNDLAGRSRYARRMEGMTFREIADEDGVSYGAVQLSIAKYAERSGLPAKFPPSSSAKLGADAIAKALGVSQRSVHEWFARGLIPGIQHGKQQRYILDDVKAALEEVGWKGGRLHDPATTRGRMMLARSLDTPGTRTCGRCGERLPLSAYPPSSGRTGGWQCRPCRKPYTRASDIRRHRAKANTQVVAVDIRVVAERDCWKCGICGGDVTRADWSMDHVIALSKGGAHTYGNVLLAHALCNSIRGNRPHPRCG